MAKVKLIDQIIAQAGEGKTSAPFILWQSQIARLKKKGFDITIVSPTKRFRKQFSCIVSWEKPSGRAADIMLIIANSSQHNPPRV